MTRTELAQEAWKVWVKDKLQQSEDTAKGFQEGFNFCLLGKIKVEGGDKGELISENFYLQDRLMRATELLKWALHSDPEHDDDFEQKWEEAKQFLKEAEKKK